ncbi:MAG TPA: response regulator [Tepidisphaeraceae bacterium]|jgi:hypothetical protein
MMTPSPIKCLLVDDLEENRLALEGLLRREGLELHMARSGPEALELLLIHDFALVILDVQMPGMDGFELANLMRGTERTRHVPIIFLTAGGIDGEHRFRGYEAGAVDFLFKPIEPQVLRSKASIFFELYRQRQEVARQRDELRTAAQENAQLLEKSRRAAEALRESEGRFRQLADAVPQIVWVVDPHGKYEYFNERWYQFTGVTEDSTILADWSRLFHPDDQERVRQHWRKCLASGETYEIEYRLLHNSGTYRWVLGRAQPIRNSEGKIERWFGSCTDIDAMKRLTAEREDLLRREQQSRASAEQESRVKDEFLATLSHELRTPLNAILGWTQIIGQGNPADEDTREGLIVIERNARAQVQLIEDLLDMSRITSGKVRLNMQPLHPADVVQAALDTIQPAADTKGVRLIKSIDPAGVNTIVGDPHRLQQVIWNLLTNAVKFTRRDGTVEVRLEQGDELLNISVSDSGEGIEPDFLSHVFDRFRQADGTTTRQHGGLGLGLSIVKNLVELHGGLVRATSAGTNRGATFVVSLPSKRLPPEAAAMLPPPAAVKNTPGKDDHCDARLDGVKVLIVDDEDDARDLMRRLLGACGAKVLLAASSAEAIEVLQQERPNVLVSDIGMPGEDGYALIRRVRALAADDLRTIPAIALTAFARAEDRQRTLNAGYHVHLAKPVEAGAVISAVAGLCPAADNG